MSAIAVMVEPVAESAAVAQRQPMEDRMTENQSNSVLITGANAGLGRELARQLGARDEIARVYLGCRDRQRGQAALDGLTAETGRDVFRLVIVDVADVDSVRTAVAALPGPVDALVMNAGGSGGKRPATRTRDGVTQIFAVNVLGHAALLEGLIAAGKLTKVAVLVGSEAARGVSRLGIPRPAFASGSVDEFASVIDGRYYDAHKFSGPGAYGQVKYLGALWMGSMARRHPQLRFVTMSPGGTRGTGTASEMNPVMRFVYNHIMMGLIAKKITHTVDVGAARLVNAVQETGYGRGTFYGSAENTLTGPVLDQSTIFPDLADQQLQDNAGKAIQQYLGALARP
jgi:NAD(P)-dependent dehydrogenase (short-subunit alcohol dehydrogenase family)